MSDMDRIARALESIAESLAKLANPLVKVDGGPIEAEPSIYRRPPMSIEEWSRINRPQDQGSWYRMVPDTTARYVDAEANRLPNFTVGPED